MAYSAEDKTRAIAILNRYGGITREARQEIDVTLGRAVSTSTLSGWLAKSETQPQKKFGGKSKTKTKTKKAKSELVNFSADEPSENLIEGLTPMQHQWINEYLRCWNATEAAKRAGYEESSAYQRGWENRHHPKIAPFITEQVSAYMMSAEEAMARLTVLASTSLQDMIDPLTGSIDLVEAVKNGSIQAIKKYRVIETEFGTRSEVELYDKQAALQTIWKNQRTLAGQPTEIIAMMPMLQEIFALLNELGRDPSTLFDKMLQRLHTERSRLKDTGSTAG